LVKAAKSVRRNDVVGTGKLAWDQVLGLNPELASEHEEYVKRDPLAAGLDVGDRAAAEAHLARKLGLAEPARPSLPNAFAERSVEGVHGVSMRAQVNRCRAR
jgi:hypothetical protein